MSLIYKTVD